MIDPDDFDDRTEDDPAAPWWGRRGSRNRVREMVRQSIENDKARRAVSERQARKRHMDSWTKLHQRFDPPTDIASISHRLHLPYTGTTEVTQEQTASDEEEIEDGDDGPPRGGEQ